MARMARVVVAGYPHHITQRGNRRQKTFFCADDYQRYLELMSEYTRESRTGRPLGSEGFVKEIERICGLTLTPKKSVPKPKV